MLLQYTHLTDKMDRIARAILCVALHAVARYKSRPNLVQSSAKNWGSLCVSAITETALNEERYNEVAVYLLRTIIVVTV